MFWPLLSSSFVSCLSCGSFLGFPTLLLSSEPYGFVLCSVVDLRLLNRPSWVLPSLLVCVIVMVTPASFVCGCLLFDLPWSCCLIAFNAFIVIVCIFFCIVSMRDVTFAESRLSLFVCFFHGDRVGGFFCDHSFSSSICTFELLPPCSFSDHDFRVLVGGKSPNFSSNVLSVSETL